jgi:hypothetical protein
MERGWQCESPLEVCINLGSFVKSRKLSAESLRNTCVGLTTAYKQNSIKEFFAALVDTDNIRTEMEVPHGDNIPSLNHEGSVLLPNVKNAFHHTYHERVRDSFLEYLDVQWGEMVAGYLSDPRGTLVSLCGSIVQSSCTGKSRLVEEYSFAV